MTKIQSQASRPLSTVVPVTVDAMASSSRHAMGAPLQSEERCVIWSLLALFILVCFA